MNWINKLTTPIFLTLTVAIGAVLRFWDIAKSSIWHDEGYTMMLAPDGVLEILWRTGRDVHPPLYYVALHYWMELFGTTEAAARSLSVVFMLACIPIGYLLVKRLCSESAGRLAAIFVAFGPFLVRYSQEARMYAMVAFILLLSTYFLVRAVESKSSNKWFVFYAVTIAAALYTHYYSIFMILVHWSYVLYVTSRKDKRGLFDYRWWLANFAGAALFLPWLPSALAQVKRVQASFWIPPSNIETLPNTLMQFMVYNNLTELGKPVKLGISFIFVGFVVGLWVYAKKYRSSTFLMAAYALAAPVLVVMVSVLLSRPIYVDRYFVFSAVAFYALLAIILVHGWPFAKKSALSAITAAVMLVVFMIGNLNVYKYGNHQMREIGRVVNEQYQNGDEIISGELYTFFDFSYYNKTATETKLWAKNGINGYGETSLIFDRADQVVVKDLAVINPSSGYVWVVGKTGPKDYFDKVPANWQPVGPKYEYGYSAAQKFAVSR